MRSFSGKKKEAANPKKTHNGGRALGRPEGPHGVLPRMGRGPPPRPSGQSVDRADKPPDVPRRGVVPHELGPATPDPLPLRVVLPGVVLPAAFVP